MPPTLFIFVTPIVTGLKAAAMYPFEAAAPSLTPIGCVLKLGTTTSPWIPDMASSQGFQYFFTVHKAKTLAEE